VHNVAKQKDLFIKNKLYFLFKQPTELCRQQQHSFYAFYSKIKTLKEMSYIWCQYYHPICAMYKGTSIKEMVKNMLFQEILTEGEGSVWLTSSLR
jgi:hypothetical protein